MFLDTFMDDASEGIMENPIPELEDLQLECVVSLEAAYSDLMLEGCQAEFQAFCENNTEILNEGIVSSIINFFKKIWRIICKVFGFNNSGGSSGGGGSPEEAISKCHARLRKLMSRPESEIRSKLESWKKIKICKSAFLINNLWHTDDDSIIDDIDNAITDHISASVLSTPSESYKKYMLNDFFESLACHALFAKVQKPKDMTADNICSAYSNYIANSIHSYTTTLYDEVESAGLDIQTRMEKLGTNIDTSEIDVKQAMTNLEKNLVLMKSFSPHNGTTWKMGIEYISKQVEEIGKEHPEKVAFICSVIKDFSQIVIHVTNTNRKLYARYLKTLYHALAAKRL